MDPNAMPGVDAPPPAPPVQQPAAAYQPQTTPIEQLFNMIQPMLVWFNAQQAAAAHPPVIPTAAPAPIPGPGVATAVEKSKLKKIDGKSPKYLAAWFNQARAYILAHPSMGAASLDQPASVFFVSTHFDGDLMAWWSAKQDDTGDHLSGGFDNFADLEDAVLKQYRIVDPKEDARLKLVSLRQTGSIEEYCHKHVTLNAHLGSTRSTDDKVKFFINGLKQYEKEYVTRGKPTTLDEAIALATEAARLYDTSRVNPAPRRVRFNTGGGSGATPMDLDALLVERTADAVLAALQTPNRSRTPRPLNRPRYHVNLPAAERQRRRDLHLCFICGKKHEIWVCDQLEAALKDGRVRRVPN